MINDKLTEQSHWDNYWENVQLPVEIKSSESNFVLKEELKIFEKYLPKEKLSILEIGGAPGQYLAYFHKEYGYEVSCLDYSEIGCEKTRDNFKRLNIPITVYQRDIFADLSDLPRFDVVYSMGLIEHFENVEIIIKKHLELLKPGGLLFLGLPNFRGINKVFLKRLAPEMLKQHNLLTMDISSWKNFEEKLKIKPVFKAYIGGFEPVTFLVQEKKSFINNLYYLKARFLSALFYKNFGFLRRFNSGCFSGYIMGVYKKI